MCNSGARRLLLLQNSSKPSSRKKYKVLHLTCVVNCTAGTPRARLCSVVQWSVHWASSRATRVLVLAGAGCCALETCGKKNLMICKKIASMFLRYEVKSSHGEISISSVLHVCLPSGDYFKFAFYSKQKLPAALACRVTALDASLMLSATST